MSGLFEPEPFEQIAGQLSMETDADHCEACGAPDDGTQSYCEQCGEALIDPKYIPEDVQPPEPSPEPGAEDLNSPERVAQRRAMFGSFGWGVSEPEPEPIPRKRWKYRSQGRYVVGRLMPDGRLDIYRGANTEAGAARARSEIRHWPEVTTYDQATDTYRNR